MQQDVKDVGCGLKAPEILAPAGDMTCLQAAIDAGADAVYFGLGEFNMRQRAGVNFTIDDLPEIQRRCEMSPRVSRIALNSQLSTLNPQPSTLNPKFVITDSQAFGEVDAALPPTIPLTSFSVLFARAKGDLNVFCEGLAALKALNDGDTVLVAEGCTHHRQCGDIGTVKLPKAVAKLTGKTLNFVFCSGGDFPLLPNHQTTKPQTTKPPNHQTS